MATQKNMLVMRKYGVNNVKKARLEMAKGQFFDNSLLKTYKLRGKNYHKLVQHGLPYLRCAKYKNLC